MDAEIRTTIRKFLDRYFRSADLQDDDDIFKSGYVNSLFAMQLVLFVEDNYHFQVANEDLTIENFHAVSALAHFIGRKVPKPGNLAVNDGNAPCCLA